MRLHRIQKIEDYINQHQTVSLDELCEEFQVSKNTIRRDTNYLAEKGAINKVYGGVVALAPIQTGFGTRDFEARNVENLDAKIKIGQKAAELIKENSIVFIDSGTTTKHILSDLKRSMQFTLLTNNLDVINLATEFPFVKIILIGDSFKRSTRSFVDVVDNPNVPQFNIDIAFMSATAFSINTGVSNSDPLEQIIKKRVVSEAQETFLLADNSKLGKSALHSYARLSSIDGLITNSPIPKEYSDYLEEHNVKLMVT